MSESVVVAGSVGVVSEALGRGDSSTTINVAMNMSKTRRLEIDTLTYAQGRAITDLVREAVFRYLDQPENRAVIDTILEARNQAQKRSVA